MKYVIGGLLALVLIVAVLVGCAKLWAFVQAHDRAASDAKKEVAESSIASQALMSIDTGASNMTFSEMFDRIDARLKTMDDDAISISASPLAKSERECLAQYLQSLQNVIRLEEQKYRKILAYSTAQDAWSAEQADYKATPYSEYTFASENQRLKSSLDEVLKALKEKTSASSQYLDGLKSLQAFMRARSVDLNRYTTINTDQLKLFIKSSFQ